MIIWGFRALRYQLLKVAEIESCMRDASREMGSGEPDVFILGGLNTSIGAQRDVVTRAAKNGNGPRAGHRSDRGRLGDVGPGPVA